MRHLTLLMTIIIFISACSTAPRQENEIENKWIKDKWIGEFVEGWDLMVRDLNDFTGKPKDLLGKKYELKILLDGEWQLIIFPVEAFKVRRTGTENLFEAEIINAKSLYETSGGLSRLTYVQAELKKIGGEKGTIELTPETDCLFKIKFIQKNGEPVDFDRLQERYEYEFVISPSTDVEVYSVTPQHVTLRRVGNRTASALLRLLLVDKKTKETFYSNQVDVPKCGYQHVLTAKPEQKKYFVVHDPGQCIRHLKSYGVPLDKTKVHKVYQKEEFYNMCPYPIKCKLTAKYGYVQKGKIVDADTRIYEFSIKPEGHKMVDTSFNYLNQQYEFDAKVYMATKASKGSFPKGHENTDMPGFLECKFE